MNDALINAISNRTGAPLNASTTPSTPPSAEVVGCWTMTFGGGAGAGVTVTEPCGGSAMASPRDAAAGDPRQDQQRGQDDDKRLQGSLEERRLRRQWNEFDRVEQERHHDQDDEDEQDHVHDTPPGCASAACWTGGAGGVPMAAMAAPAITHVLLSSAVAAFSVTSVDVFSSSHAFPAIVFPDMVVTTTGLAFSSPTGRYLLRLSIARSS